MPAMAAIVVKKADDVTNITYDVLTPSSGDGTDAVWRQDTGASAAVPVGHRATFAMRTRWNGPRTARRMNSVFVRPYSVLNTTTGLYQASDQVIVKVEVLSPQGMPAAELNEGVYQGLNLAGALLTRQAASSGFAPQ